VNAELNTIIELLTEWDPHLRADGFRRLDCLEEAPRVALADALMRTTHPIRWQAAARCLLTRDTASRRLRLFAARCALRRLEDERDAGREPPELAWRAVELAERLARGPVSARELMDTRDEVEGMLILEPDYGCPGDDDLWFESVASLQSVPGGRIWEQIWEIGAGIPERDIVKADARESDALAESETWDASSAATYAAALSIQPEEPEGKWPPYETIVPPAETLDEHRWQESAFEIIVLRGADVPGRLPSAIVA